MTCSSHPSIPSYSLCSPLSPILNWRDLFVLYLGIMLRFHSLDYHLSCQTNNKESNSAIHQNKLDILNMKMLLLGAQINRHNFSFPPPPFKAANMHRNCFWREHFTAFIPQEPRIKYPPLNLITVGWMLSWGLSEALHDGNCESMLPSSGILVSLCGWNVTQICVFASWMLCDSVSFPYNLPNSIHQIQTLDVIKWLHMCDSCYAVVALCKL